MAASERKRFYLNPHKIILRKKIIDGFRAFSRADYKPLLALYDENVRQTFEGDHALGGARTNKQDVERWFQRFVRLLPSTFVIKDVVVQGWPWNTKAIVVFEDHVSPVGVSPYTNQGIMNTTVKWGKATYVHIYVNTHLVIEALNALSKPGVEEAGAEPIT